METNPAIALFLALAVIIAASRLGGSLSRLIGQPRVLGELLIGLLLGPTLLNLLHWPILHGINLQETIKELAEFGVLLLMFLIGLEVDLRELASVGKLATITGVLGALAPVVLTAPLVILFGYTWQPALFAGVTLAATSVSISAQVLLELGHLRSRVGSALLATALIDDVLAILLVSIATALTAPTATQAASGNALHIALIILQMAAYLTIAFLISWFILPRIINWLANFPIVAQSYGIPALALVVALLFAWSAEELGGVAAITGAFIAGLGLSRTRERLKDEIETGASYIAHAFLVPIFFIDVGLEVNLRLVPLTALPLAGLLFVVAIISKVSGCGLGALWGGFSRRDSLRLGVCMISRGEVGLIIAALGLSAGVFTAADPLFATLFLVILLTTLVTPLLVRWIFPRNPADRPHPLGDSAPHPAEGSHP